MSRPERPALVVLGAITALALAALGVVLARARAAHAPGVAPARSVLVPARPELGSAPELTHAVIVGDPHRDRVTLWARSSAPATVHVSAVPAHERGRSATAAEPRHAGSALTHSDRDQTAKVVLGGLEPNTSYTFVAWATAPGASEDAPRSPSSTGRFRTAPALDTSPPLRFAFGGDIAGQNVCRPQNEGLPAVAAVARLTPDFFVALGDLIYADDECAALGAYGQPQIPGRFPRAQRREEYWAHWRYAWEDPGFRALFASTNVVAVWDDHEVSNDSGPHDDVRTDPPYDGRTHLMPLGQRAFFDYLPVAEPASGVVGLPLYRRLEWGRTAELFVLDTRQYRDRNDTPDTGPTPKTLLGPAQREWLVASLVASRATWKIVVSSVPLSIPTGHSGFRDGWANHDTETGFERELLGVLAALRRARVENLLFITTDVHFGAGFHYRPFEGADFELHELVSGPLHAGVFGHEEYDRTLGPTRRFYHGPTEPVRTYDEARGWFNFGLVEALPGGRLNAQLRDANGQVVAQLELRAR